jgi:hypothetical protein
MYLPDVMAGRRFIYPFSMKILNLQIALGIEELAKVG